MSETVCYREKARQLLVEHLLRARRDGAKSEWLGERSRGFLIDLFKAKNAGKPISYQPKEEAAPRVESPAPTPTRDRPVAKRDKKAMPEPPPGVKKPNRMSPPAVAVPRDGSKEGKIGQLKEGLAACSVCTAIPTLRDQMVFSVGNPDAELMLIGEAPGVEEEKLSQPFVGPAGGLLDKIITTMGLRRDQVYISNIVKYRPLIPGVEAEEQGSRNRKPTPHEMELFMPYLRAEVQVVQPRVIVALGATAIEGLLGESTSVGRAREKWHRFGSIPFRATYHPSYLLREKSLTERRKLWLDMLAVMEELGMPITEKQRGFFREN